jgi:hypothetical protein
MAKRTTSNPIGMSKKRKSLPAEDTVEPKTAKKKMSCSKGEGGSKAGSHQKKRKILVLVC